MRLSKDVNQKLIKMNKNFVFPLEEETLKKLTNHEHDWSSVELRGVLRLFYLNSLFNIPLEIYHFPNEIRTKELAGYFEGYKQTDIEIFEKEELAIISNYFKSSRLYVDRITAPIYSVDRYFLFYKLRILLTPSHFDFSQSKLFTTLQSTLGLKQVRIKSLNNSKFYGSNDLITKLRVATLQEIAGFQGLDYIEFKGESVKHGLRGLQVRQEIKVNLENIGPKIIVGDSDLTLKVGSTLEIHSLKGIQKAHELLIT